MTMSLNAAQVPPAPGGIDGKPHLSVQILSTLLFGAFAITAVALAFAHFWPAGLLLAVLLGWRGGFVPRSGPPERADEIIASLRALGPEAETRGTGNASFDAYRSDTLRRLEEEQERFGDFLIRLRDARDAQEFDRFLDERSAAAPK